MHFSLAPLPSGWVRHSFSDIDARGFISHKISIGVGYYESVAIFKNKKLKEMRQLIFAKETKRLVSKNRLEKAVSDLSKETFDCRLFTILELAVVKSRFIEAVKTLQTQHPRCKEVEIVCNNTAVYSTELFSIQLYKVKQEAWA